MGPSNENSYQVWFQLAQWFERRLKPYILISTCVLTNKLQTSFLIEFMYSYRTVVHTNIKMLMLFFTTQISKRFASYRHFDRGNSD
jgi:hypothetical protein